MCSKKQQPKFLFTAVIVAAINTPRCIIDRKDCNICVLRIVNLGQACKQNYSKIEKKKNFLLDTSSNRRGEFVYLLRKQKYFHYSYYGCHKHTKMHQRPQRLQCVISRLSIIVQVMQTKLLQICTLKRLHASQSISLGVLQEQQQKPLVQTSKGPIQCV